MMLLLLNNTNNMYNRDHIMSKMTSKGYNMCFDVLWMWFLKFEKTVTLRYINNTVLEYPKKALSYKNYNFSFVMK